MNQSIIMIFFCVIVNLMNLITLHLDFVLLNSDYNSVSGLTLLKYYYKKKNIISSTILFICILAKLNYFTAGKHWAF
jgi:hypothetical protein